MPHLSCPHYCGFTPVLTQNYETTYEHEIKITFIQLIYGNTKSKLVEVLNVQLKL